MALTVRNPQPPCRSRTLFEAGEEAAAAAAAEEEGEEAKEAAAAAAWESAAAYSCSWSCCVPSLATGWLR